MTYYTQGNKSLQDVGELKQNLTIFLFLPGMLSSKNSQEAAGNDVLKDENKDDGKSNDDSAISFGVSVSSGTSTSERTSSISQASHLTTVDIHAHLPNDPACTAELKGRAASISTLEEDTAVFSSETSLCSSTSGPSEFEPSPTTLKKGRRAKATTRMSQRNSPNQTLTAVDRRNLFRSKTNPNQYLAAVPLVNCSNTSVSQRRRRKDSDDSVESNGRSRLKPRNWVGGHYKNFAFQILLHLQYQGLLPKPCLAHPQGSS